MKTDHITTLQSRAAIIATQNRHSLLAWETNPKRVPLSNATSASAPCSKCGQRIFIRARKAPGDPQISGLSTPCPGAP